MEEALVLTIKTGICRMRTCIFFQAKFRQQNQLFQMSLHMSPNLMVTGYHYKNLESRIDATVLQ